MSLINNIKEITKHGSVYMIGLFVNIVLQVALLPVFTRYLTTSEYGIVAILESAIEVVKVACSMGIGDSIVRFFHDNEEEKNFTPISTGIVILASISFLFGFILIIYNKPLTTIILGDDKFSLFFVMTVLRVLVAVVRTGIDSYFMIQKKSKFFVYANTGQVLLNSIVNLFLVVYLGLGVFGILLGNLIVAVSINAYLLFKVFNEIPLSFDMRLAVRMFRFSAPLAISVLCVTGMHNLDRFFVRSFLSLEAVGLYSLAYRFPFQLYSLFALSFNRIWKGSTLYAIAQSHDSIYQFKKMTTYYMLLTGLALYSLGIFSHMVVKILAAPEYISASQYIPILSMGVWIYGLHNCINYAVFVTKKSNLAMLNNVVALSVNIGLNLSLIPTLGIIGAALATVITYTVYSLLAFFLYRKFYPVMVEYVKLIHFFALALVLTIVRLNLIIDIFFIELLVNVLFVFLLVFFVYWVPWILTNGEREHINIFVKRIGYGFVFWRDSSHR